MVALEKAGIPAVGIVARSFVRAWQSCVDGWGQPSTAFVTIPHATTGQQADFIRKMVDEQIDAIIRGLTTLPAAAGTTSGAQGGSKTTEIFTVEMDATPAGLDAVNRFLAERDWSDGLPVIPPTPAAVEQMLQGTRRQPQDVLMVMEPGFGLATVEKIAINAVMAGCRPEQFPVLLAAIDCLAQPQMNHRDMQVSGHTEAPLILVNGPIAKKAGINYGTSAMGPGVVNSANTAIGRALRLCLINIGYCKAGAGDPNFIGLPTKFGMCLAENEEVSPWQPYHVDQGFKRDDSAVTVVVVTGPTDYHRFRLQDPRGHPEQHRLDDVLPQRRRRRLDQGMAIRPGGPQQQAGVVPGPLPPHHPQPVPGRHPGRGRHEQAGCPGLAAPPLPRLAAGRPGHARHAQGCQRHVAEPPGAATSGARPQATIPALESPEQYLLFVSGGSTHYAHFFYGTYGMATMPVEEG